MDELTQVATNNRSYHNSALLTPLAHGGGANRSLRWGHNLEEPRYRRRYPFVVERSGLVC